MINIEKNKKIIIDLLKSTKRKNIDALIRAMEKSDFFIAPASAKYHLAEQGGLAQHSLNVYQTFRDLCDKYKIQLPQTTIIIVGLLHDICKVHNYIYNPITKKFRRRLISSKDHGSKSVRMITKYIELDAKEEALIRWHMARYTWDGNFKAMEYDLKKEHPEVYMLYFADHISTLYLEEDNDKS